MGAGFQSRGGGSGGFATIGGKYTGLGSFSVYQSDLGRFVESYFYEASRSSRDFTRERDYGEIPHSTAPVPVAKSDKRTASLPRIILPPGKSLPSVVLGADGPLRTWEQGARDTRQPPIIFSPPPIILPGQTSPGREEHEAQANQSVSEPEADMAIDWGGAFSAGIDLLQGQTIGGGLAPAQFAGPAQFTSTPTGAPPAKVTVDTRTGKITPCRRRRRKPLLTDADFAALAKVASLPNNANVRTALAQAIRR